MAFAPSKRKRRRKSESPGSMTSMMDMMTIILLFLLKSYSSTGALLQPAFKNLPQSTVEKAPERNLAIVISQDGCFADVDAEVKPMIAPVEEFKDDSSPSIPSLEDYIMQQQERDQVLGKKVTDQMTIQAADDIPYSWILKVTQTGSEAGIQKYDFVIIKIQKPSA
ncbi:MAG: biopolymer transporter ExbD [Candidatus Electryonea clarkiae]|nr:biopolymer transporter ExbD [Candidatus Electryonea clarkiae]MDP8286261.1 biopolymer transporter ExbD [Candidatus Electryonea clarkiae]